ncbi:hypothetical protein [Desulfonema magnum]|uniref:Uncharacterized protein n=1 Tax=Desulfonema magnum TaxID=45655 RepID=A0A975GQ46_9BACT|nr:hypothetical protein [Desulfonema magnum]QTA89666.1 Uncharacterized protein dnm_057230 [Desulfonema magnum]
MKYVETGLSPSKSYKMVCASECSESSGYELECRGYCKDISADDDLAKSPESEKFPLSRGMF